MGTQLKHIDKYRAILATGEHFLVPIPDDWLDMVNGKLVNTFGAFTIQRNGPPQYDEDSEYGIALDQEIELGALGLLGRDFVLPVWAKRAGLAEASQLNGITTKYGDLDYGEFLRLLEVGGPLEQDHNLFIASLRAGEFRSTLLPLAFLNFYWWALLLLIIFLFPIVFLLGWQFGKNVALPVAGVLLFGVPWAAHFLDQAATQRLVRRAETDPAFFRYIFEHGLLRVPQGSTDVPSFLEAWGPLAYLIMTVPGGLLALCSWLIFTLARASRQ